MKVARDPMYTLRVALGLLPGETAELGPAVAEYAAAIRQRAVRGAPNTDHSPPVVIPAELSVDYYFRPGGPLSTLVNGWEMRPSQLEMARRVERALQEGRTLFAEAGTGTGKSLAYLVPAAIWAMTNGETVVVSTYTVNLQEQLWNKEIPLLEKLFPGLAAGIMFGRSRYPCLDKFLAHLASAPATSVSPSTLAARAAWIYEAAGQEKAPRGPAPESWGDMAAMSEECTGEECEWFRTGCFVTEARRRGAQVHILVVNHALLLAELKADANFLPPYKAVILDEAHHLPAVAQDQFGERLTDDEIAGFLETLTGRRAKRGQALFAQAGTGEIAALATELEEKVAQVFDPMEKLASPGASGQAWDWSDLPAGGEGVRTAGSELALGLGRLAELLHQRAEEEGSDRRSRTHIARQAQKASSLAVRLQVVLGIAASDAMVYWLKAGSNGRLQGSSTRSTGVELHATPLHTGDILRDRLWSRVEAAVLTSATLATPPRGFRFLEEELGLDGLDDTGGEVSHVVLPSPFHYRDQALVAVATDLPDPRAPGEFVAAVARVLPALVRQAGGRTLVLFTAREMLRAVHALVANELNAAGIEVLAQDAESERGTMLARLAQNEGTVIFGLQSFWEGVDVTGPALSQVVIVRLPFDAYQNPVQQARLAEIERQGGSGFLHLSLPAAVLRFRQGFGRLVRTSTDRGVVVVLDPRLYTARYGRAFWDALPGPRRWCGPAGELPEIVGLWLGGQEPPAGDCGEDF